MVPLRSGSGYYRGCAGVDIVMNVCFIVDEIDHVMIMIMSGMYLAT